MSPFKNLSRASLMPGITGSIKGSKPSFIVLSVNIASIFFIKSLYLTLLPNDNLLYISCVLDINIPDNRFKDVYSFLFSLNERLLVGHFEIWSDQSWPILKQSFPIPTNQSLCKSQLEQASLLVLRECEKFYPAFQIFAWDNKDLKSTLQHLMLETHGEV